MPTKVKRISLKRNGRSCLTAKLQRVLCRINFRHDFTKSNSRKVRTTVISRNSRITEFPKCMVLAKIIAQHDNGYIDKLLEIRIVANKRSESFSRALIRLSEVCFPSSISLKSTGEREKKAISEADTKPEAYNNKTANKIAMMAPMVGAVTVTPSNKSAKRHKYESGSKESGFS